MRATPLVRCAGAPRDLGLDQGRACRDEIRADARAHGFAVSEGIRARLAALMREDPPAIRALARDVARHFPHLAERAAGLAAGSGVGESVILEALARELDPNAASALHCDGGRAGDALELRIALPAPLTGFVARECSADGGYRSLGLARPAHIGVFAGVNERGLAGIAVPLAAPARDERCVAPGVLLLDQCIERLDRVEKALEWCEHRPGGGRALLLFCDASGACAGIEIDGEKRHRCDAPQARGDGISARVDPRARTLAIAPPGIAPVPFSLGAPS